MIENLCLIKLGGSIITNTEKSRSARKGAIRRLLKEIKEAKEQASLSIIIGHGSGSFGHIPAQRYKVNEGLINDESMKGAIITLNVAKELNRIVTDAGLDMGLNLFPFSSSSMFMGKSRTISYGVTQQIEQAMKSNFVPLVYGDVILDTEKGVSIASTEEILRFISMNMKPSKIIFATDVDGVCFSDPKTNKETALIAEINSSNIAGIMDNTSTITAKVDVTGGMKSKIANLYSMVKDTGATGIILNGQRKGNLKKALLDRKLKNATYVRP